MTVDESAVDERMVNRMFRLHSDALHNAGQGEIPEIEVTQEEYELIQEYGSPWTELVDGREMWGGVVVEVKI